MSKMQVMRFFEKVSDAVFAGNHRIFIPPGLFEYLVTLNMFSVTVSGSIKKIGEDSPQLGDFINDVEIPKLTLKYHESGLNERQGNRFIIDHKKFIGGQYLLEPILIVENKFSDGEFYQIMFDLEAERIDFPPAKFAIQHLGGKSQLQKALKTYAKEKRIVVFILDLDSIVPITAIERVKRQQNLESILNVGNCVGLVKYTPTHEIENFLPLSIVSKIVTNARRKNVPKVERLIKKQGNNEVGDCLWLYYDVKRGVIGKRNKNGVIGIKKFQQLSQKDKIWLCKKYCIAISESEIEKLNYPGFGEQVVDHFLKHSDRKKMFNSFIRHRENDFNYWSYHFSDWMKSLIWLGCSDNELLIV